MNFDYINEIDEIKMIQMINFIHHCLQRYSNFTIDYKSEKLFSCCLLDDFIRTSNSTQKYLNVL
jgi:hypothetical protein